MTKPNKLNFTTVYKILLSVSIIIAAICLICGCVYIFYSGDGYSREIVSSTFSKICIPIYICLVLILGSFIVNIFFKDVNKKQKFFKIKNFKQNAEPKFNEKTLLIIKIFIIIIGISAVIFGAITGGFADVLTKAINICTECIGLG